jgi:hypothetical protein
LRGLDQPEDDTMGFRYLVLLASLLALGGCAPQLDADHPGYGKQPNCWTAGCHDRSHTMKSTDWPYQCADCHGNNGAPASHVPQSADACGPCHGQMHGGPSAGFIDPVACDACHG